MLRKKLAYVLSKAYVHTERARETDRQRRQRERERDEMYTNDGRWDTEYKIKVENEESDCQ